MRSVQSAVYKKSQAKYIGGEDDINAGLSLSKMEHSCPHLDRDAQTEACWDKERMKVWVVMDVAFGLDWISSGLRESDWFVCRECVGWGVGDIDRKSVNGPVVAASLFGEPSLLGVGLLALHGSVLRVRTEFWVCTNRLTDASAETIDLRISVLVNEPFRRAVTADLNSDLMTLIFEVARPMSFSNNQSHREL